MFIIFALVLQPSFLLRCPIGKIRIFSTGRISSIAIVYKFRFNLPYLIFFMLAGDVHVYKRRRMLYQIVPVRWRTSIIDNSPTQRSFLVLPILGSLFNLFIVVSFLLILPQLKKLLRITSSSSCKYRKHILNIAIIALFLLLIPQLITCRMPY